MKRIFLLFFLVGILVVSGCTNGNVVMDPEKRITVYKSASCGCCSGYVAELKRQGFNVETVLREDMFSIKNQYNIPKNMESCHTSVIGNYFIEGHVPIEAVNMLLESKPEIDGIALPNMPAGSPGMPGFKSEPFKIYALTNGEVSEFMSV